MNPSSGNHFPQSWVEGANDSHGFGLNHLPYGAFRLYDKTWLCVRIGEYLLNLADCVADELFDELSPDLRQACLQSTLNDLLSLGPREWNALRGRLIEMLVDTAPDDLQERVDVCLYPLQGIELVLPIAVGNYTDFYASIHHARRIGEIFRPEQPLLPNYKHVPIGYHGRASSVVVSGTEIRRPWGQSRPAGESALPNFAPSAALDYEVELAFIVGQGNALGEPVPVAAAAQHLFGVALLNDWSARDIQAWEYQPLGPFLGKSFATSVSPWITPFAALEPFRMAALSRAPGDPQVLDYLHDEGDQNNGALDIRISTSFIGAGSTAPTPLGTTNTRDLYWTPAQLVAHHTSNGCNLKPGDVLASGTLSGPERSSAGCLMELTRNGFDPLQLAGGEQRDWLHDGDEIILTASCERPGEQTIQLGACMGRILPARA